MCILCTEILKGKITLKEQYNAIIEMVGQENISKQEKNHRIELYMAINEDLDNSLKEIEQKPKCHCHHCEPDMYFEQQRLFGDIE